MINQENIIIVLTQLLSNSYPVKNEAILKFFANERNNFDEVQQEPISKLLSEYQIRSDNQRQSGLDHCRKVKKAKEVNKPNYKAPFTIPSFKANFKGRGKCETCQEAITPGPTFFLVGEDGSWRLWHPLPLCFPEQFKLNMINSKSYISWQKVTE